jgi:hypothetical protein
MANQNIEIEEPFIDDSINEDYKPKGPYNGLYNFVVNQPDDFIQSQLKTTNAESGLTANELSYVRESRPIQSGLRFSRNSLEDGKEPIRHKENMSKSREIHRQLLSRKNRWKPSELELAVLKLHFEKNRYPTKEEKESLLKNLEEKFKSTIELSQLTRWFQHERERGIKHGFKSMSKNTYRKFGKEELEFLKKHFAENTYPKNEEMIEFAKKLGVSFSKIENWYKHNRRSLAKKGCFELKTKKYFKRDEVQYLLKMFDAHPRPSKEQILEMAKSLNCNELQVKNWYSNKRKKQKFIAKKQCVENQEGKLHQIGAPVFSQFNLQSTEIFPNFQISSPSLGPQNSSVSQVIESTPITPQLISNRPVNGYQTPQFTGTYPTAPVPTVVYANGMYPNTSYPNGAYPNVSYSNGALTAGSYPNGVMPVLLIPTTCLNPVSSFPITLPNNNSTTFPMQEVDFKYHQQLQQQPLLANTFMNQPNSANLSVFSFGNNTPQHVKNTVPSPLPNSVFKQTVPTTGNAGNSEVFGGNWMNQGQAIQSSSPMVMLPNNNRFTPVMTQQGPFSVQDPSTNFTPVSVIPTAYNPTTISPNNFVNPNDPNMTNQFLAVQPMQIQYVTRLYCPYSNNNIFSNYYPPGSQNGPNSGGSVIEMDGTPSNNFSFSTQ